MFADRTDAATQLATRLGAYRGRHALVLGIPRGGVPMAARVAKLIDGELDVVLVHKLRTPWAPEVAIGAIDESGRVYGLTANATDAKQLAAEIRLQLATLRKRRQRYSPVRAPVDASGRCVIIVDDGLATGSTMLAALQVVRANKPQHLVCAVPVAPADTLQRIGEMADEVVCLESPEPFYAVGQIYRQFPDVSDDEVVAALTPPA